jgi:hypothetical protein
MANTDENKLKHLEFIQAVINRMDKNSFFLKGWCISLMAALYALSNSNSNYEYVIIVYLTTPIFCLIDGYFLSQQRKFIWLFNEIRIKNNEDIDFNMETSGCSVTRCSWLSSIFSVVHLIFYGAIIATTLIIIYIIN